MNMNSKYDNILGSVMITLLVLAAAAGVAYLWRAVIL